MSLSTSEEDRPSKERKTFDSIRVQLDDLRDASARVEELSCDVRHRLVGGGVPIRADEEPTPDLERGPIAHFILDRLSSIRESMEVTENHLTELREEL